MYDMSLTWGKGMRDDLERDVAAVHGRESSISEVEQLLREARHGLEGALEPVAYRSEDGVGVVVLLESEEGWSHFVGWSGRREAWTREKGTAWVF